MKIASITAPTHKKLSAKLKIGKLGQKFKKIKSRTYLNANLSIKLPIAPPKTNPKAMLKNMLFCLLNTQNKRIATIITMLTTIKPVVLLPKIPHAAPVLPPLFAIETTFGIRLKYSTLNKKCLVIKSTTKTKIIVEIIVNHFFILKSCKKAIFYLLAPKFCSPLALTKTNHHASGVCCHLCHKLRQIKNLKCVHYRWKQCLPN